MKKNLKVHYWFRYSIQIAVFFGLIQVLLIGCSPAAANSNPAPTIDTAALITQAVKTVEAKYTLTAALQPSQTVSPTSLSTAAAITPTVTPTSQQPVLNAFSPTPTTAQIKGTGVAAWSAVFAVIHVFTSVNHEDIASDCPPGYTFQFYASITTNGPGEVTYNWEFSDFSKTEDRSLTFTSADTQNISSSWEIGNGGTTPGDNPYKGWARVTIVKPNNQVFTRSSFIFRCK